MLYLDLFIFPPDVASAVLGKKAFMSVNNFEDHDVQMLELSALHQWKQGADKESTTITPFAIPTQHSVMYHSWGEGLKKFSPDRRGGWTSRDYGKHSL